MKLGGELLITKPVFTVWNPTIDSLSFLSVCLLRTFIFTQIIGALVLYSEDSFPLSY